MNRVMKVTTRERTKMRERERERAHEDLASSLLFFVLFSCSKESVKISFRGRSSTHVRASGRTIELQNKSLPSSNNS